MPTALDRLITTEDRKALTLSLSEQALHHLHAYGSSISVDELTRLTAAQEGSYWTREVPITFFVNVGEHFMRLLRGELPPPPSSGPINVLP